MKGRPRPGIDRDAGDRALAELRAVFDEVDARLAGRGCDASTRCCRFGLTGREPYVTAVEALAVQRALARSGRRPPSAASPKRRLPVAVEAGERACPLLDEGGRCRIYADRPFGCRTYFCGRAIGGEDLRQREINAFVARLRAISEELGPGGGEGRPLTRCFGR